MVCWNVLLKYIQDNDNVSLLERSLEIHLNCHIDLQSDMIRNLEGIDNCHKDSQSDIIYVAKQGLHSKISAQFIPAQPNFRQKKQEHYKNDDKWALYLWIHKVWSFTSKTPLTT